MTALPEGFIAAPGVYDGVSARLGERSSFNALYVTGYGVAASRFGLPDAGLIGLGEMIDAIRVIRSCTTKPIIADGDTGYGGLLNIQHTVRSYERAGVSAVQLEDQDTPKKCGHTKGKRVVSIGEAVARIEVALESRSSPECRIIARTDALAINGFADAVARAEAFQAAGADYVMIDALETREQIRMVGSAFRGAALLNVTPSGRDFKTPMLSADEIEKMGFAIAIFPAVMATPAWDTMERSLTQLAETGLQPYTQTDALSPHELVGFPQIWADEARWDERYRAER